MSLVAIQGIRGSYSEEAAQKMFGAKAEILECLSFAETFQAVLSKRAKFALVPLKNKIVGEIKSATSIFKQTNLRILDELPLKIQHVLIGTYDAQVEKVQTICSHEEALKQCRKFLSENAAWQTIIGSDTASCVRRIIEEKSATGAAIGSRRAAEIYGGKILKENIADDLENITTFYLISKSQNRLR